MKKKIEIKNDYYFEMERDFVSKTVVWEILQEIVVYIFEAWLS